MQCQRTRQTETNWRNAVYDALYQAWSQWQRDWQAAQDRAKDMQLITGGGSATKIADLMRTEIKRQVISWLLDASPFGGIDAMKPPAAAPGGAPPSSPPWREIDFAKARASAPTIQFLEQAFEWGNMSYLLYPYFWAKRERWDELNKLESANPEFEQFLKAGSARVVLPVRPAMTDAVKHWLVYQQPFFGQPMPLPGDPLFVSLADEIHDLTQPPADGEAGNSWEVRMGTTLLWVDPSSALPHNEGSLLGRPPNTPTPLFCPT
jgi:hypothetical protein